MLASSSLLVCSVRILLTKLHQHSWLLCASSTCSACCSQGIPLLLTCRAWDCRGSVGELCHVLESSSGYQLLQEAHTRSQVAAFCRPGTAGWFCNPYRLLPVANAWHQDLSATSHHCLDASQIAVLSRLSAIATAKEQRRLHIFRVLLMLNR